jgi:hypothetical protein
MKYDTALTTVRVDTDCGEGYLKALGNKEGPHALACELVGSLAADWLGLQTFDFAVVQVRSRDEVVIANQSLADLGPGFISRAEDSGYTWGGGAQSIAAINNPQDVSTLVVVDTWLRNCDRYSPDGRRRNLNNVFLVQRAEPRRLELIAMDFTHAFTCGTPLDKRIAYIDRIQDKGIYGLFPEFIPLLRSEKVIEDAQRLGTFCIDDAQTFIANVPQEWAVDGRARGYWANFLVDRAHFVSRTIHDMLWPENGQFDYGEDTI